MDNIAISAQWIRVVDGLPFLSANAFPTTSERHYKEVFQSKYPGDYEVVWREPDEVNPYAGVTIKFNKSEDEMWHRLKHG